jgi:hypothetical protein
MKIELKKKQFCSNANAMADGTVGSLIRTSISIHGACVFYSMEGGSSTVFFFF